MSRYIDADEIDIRAREGYNRDGVLYIPYRDVRKSLDSAPSIEIIRCRECRYWHSGECWGIPYRGDYDTSIDTKADDFCSYGEREGE